MLRSCETAAESEAEPGKDPVVILTDGLAREMFGGGEAVGKDLRISGVNQQVATVLQLTNLDRVLRAHPSVEAATDGW